jgi:glycosyltransferase involved in cell wall biosynthesis
MPAPKVTVILPTFNRARYVGEAMSSVLRQTMGDLELVVVDDGSTDATADAVARAGDARVRYLHQDHRGISAAMNAGIRAARGAYVARLDSDDVWLADMLEITCGVLDARPEIGLVYGQGQAMDRDGRPLSHLRGMQQRFPGETLRSMLYDDCTCNITVLVRRSCFDRIGLFDESLIANEDWDMWLRLARHASFAYVERVLARFRWHDENLTGLRSPHFDAVVETRTRPLDKIFAEADLPAEIRAMKPVAYRNVYTFQGLRRLRRRQLHLAARDFTRAVQVADEPVTAALRIAWFVLAELLGHITLGRRLIRALADARRRRRER